MRIGFVVGAIVLALSSDALAQAGSPPARADAPDQERIDEAKGLFSAGKAAYSAGRYADALDYFERAFALSGRAALLYNIGLAAGHAGKDAQALDSYERYLSELPDAANRGEVEGRIAQIRATLERKTAPAPVAAPVPTPVPVLAETPPPAEAPPPTAPAPPPVASDASEPTEGDAPSLAQWSVLGASGAVVIAGGVFLALALSDKSSVENAHDGIRRDEIESAYDRVPTFSALGGVLLGVGLAGAAASIVWIVLDDGASDTSATVVRVGPAAVLLAGSFR